MFYRLFCDGTSKLSINHLFKVTSIVTNVNDEGVKVADGLFDKIRNFRGFYDDYLERMRQERDRELGENAMRYLK